MVLRILKTLFLPVLLLAILILLQLNITELSNEAGRWVHWMPTFIGYALPTCIGLCIASIIQRLVSVIGWDHWARRRFGGPTPRILRDISWLVIYATAILLVVTLVFQKSITGIVAVSSLSGLVLGFALQNVILDIFTGIAVHMDQPYRIGDWIKAHVGHSSDQVTGQVMEVSWRTTRLLTEENKLLIVPNSALAATVVKNYNAPTKPSRFHTYLSLDTAIPVERARRILLAGAKAAMGKENMLTDPEPMVLVTKGDGVGIEYEIRFWIHAWDPISPAIATDRVLSSCIVHLEQAGIDLTYARQELYFEPLPERHIDLTKDSGRRRILDRVELFDCLTPDEKTMLAGRMKQQSYKNGQAIIGQGEVGHEMYIVLEGLLEVLLTDTHSTVPHKVAQLQPGEFFGEMSLLTGEPRSATIKAMTDGVVFVIDQPCMQELFESRPRLFDTLGEAVAKRRLSLMDPTVAQSPEANASRIQELGRQITRKMRSMFRVMFRDG
jgi:small-conductance mechanosensitive channel/CRP-like cAMP-binding protein